MHCSERRRWLGVDDRVSEVFQKDQFDAFRDGVELGDCHGNWASHRRLCNSGVGAVGCIDDNCVRAGAGGFSGPTQTNFNASENCVRAQSMLPHVVTDFRRSSSLPNLVRNRRPNRIVSLPGFEFRDRKTRMSHHDILIRMPKWSTVRKH